MYNPSLLWLTLYSVPPTCLLPGARYDKIGGAFHADGFHVSSPEELAAALKKSLAPQRMLPAVINVEIAPTAMRKPQVRDGLTELSIILVR